MYLLLRFVEEVREQQLEEDEKDTTSYAGQQVSAKTRRYLYLYCVTPFTFVPPECNSLQSVIQLSSLFHGMLTIIIACSGLHSGAQLPVACF